MDDLIYRKELRDALYEADAVTMQGVKIINQFPAVNAVPVVRCKDCNHCDPENHHCDHYMGTVAPLRRKPDDFCSYGERKDGDGNG